jgi:transposase-like protein
VFGGVERESGRSFLVPVPDRTADTLEAIIRDRIEPGTTVISDGWRAYQNLESLGYTHRTVNHSLYFVHPDTGDHTNTIESTWHRAKVFLGPYNRRDDYHYHLAHFMFVAKCKEQGISPFLKFLHIVANTNWKNSIIRSF